MAVFIRWRGGPHPRSRVVAERAAPAPSYRVVVTAGRTIAPRLGHSSTFRVDPGARASPALSAAASSLCGFACRCGGSGEVGGGADRPPASTTARWIDIAGARDREIHCSETRATLHASWRLAFTVDAIPMVQFASLRQSMTPLAS